MWRVSNQVVEVAYERVAGRAWRVAVALAGPEQAADVVADAFGEHASTSAEWADDVPLMRVVGRTALARRPDAGSRRPEPADVAVLAFVGRLGLDDIEAVTGLDRAESYRLLLEAARDASRVAT